MITPARQTETIVHEYRHWIFSEQNPDYEIGYESSYDRSNLHAEYEHFHNYFEDINEVYAHTEQIKFALQMGKTVDEIIRDKVGGAITSENYPIAMKFKEIVDRAIAELEKEGEENEQPIEYHNQV
jgi:hypothetical protein